MEVNIQNLTQSEVDEKFVRDVLEKAAEETGVKGKDVAVVFVGENKIRNLNKQYRGKNAVTDVLSFSAEGDKEELGDVVICVARAKKQARKKGKSFENELATLLVHGALHLVGHDHEDNQSGEEMEGIEKVILDQIGVGT